MRVLLAFTVLALNGLCQSNLPDEKLRALGERLRAEILKDSPLLEVPEASSLLNRLSAQLDTTTPPVNFEIVRSNQTEICVLPGGFALLPARLLLAIQSETELARRMAHAIAHIRLRHGSNGFRDVKQSPTANLSTIPIIHIGGWDGIHRNPASVTAFPSAFRARQAQWEREAEEYATSRIAEIPTTGLTSELSRIQAQLLPLTISSKPPSLLR